MSQIKEKAPAAPASVTSANLDNQVKDTTKRLIRQVEPVNFNLEDLFILVSAVTGLSQSPSSG